MPAPLYLCLPLQQGWLSIGRPLSPPHCRTLLIKVLVSNCWIHNTLQMSRIVNPFSLPTLNLRFQTWFQLKTGLLFIARGRNLNCPWFYCTLHQQMQLIIFKVNPVFIHLSLCFPTLHTQIPLKHIITYFFCQFIHSSHSDLQSSPLLWPFCLALFLLRNYPKVCVCVCYSFCFSCFFWQEHSDLQVFFNQILNLFQIRFHLHEALPH